MVNSVLLEDRILQSGKKKGYLAAKCGMSRQYFLAKCKGKKPFNLDEMSILCDELNINTLRDRNTIFFA